MNLTRCVIKVIGKMQNYDGYPYSGIADCDLWSSFIDQSDGSIYDNYAASLYSILPPNTASHQFSVMPNTTPFIIDYNPQQYLDLALFEDLIDCRNWCLSNLRHTDEEAESLRQENVNLQMANSELSRQLPLLQQPYSSSASSVQNYSNATLSPFVCSVIDNSWQMKIGDKGTPAVRNGRHEGRRRWLRLRRRRWSRV